MGHSQKTAQSERQAMQKEIYALQARDRELDTLFERIYEDNVAGKISDERFARMSMKYEGEQKELTARIKELKAALEKSASQSVTADMFIGSVRKYTRAKKLTQQMLNELIQKIEVFNAEKINGVWQQRLTIHYNCIGSIEIQALFSLLVAKVRFAALLPADEER